MTLTDLPEIQISKHARAKHLRLRIDGQSIKLTVPTLTTKKQIQQFIDQSTPWLLETWQKQQQQKSSATQQRPTQLQLFNLDQPIEVVYVEQQHGAASFDAQQCQLFIRVDVAESALKAFVKAYAKQHLTRFLKQVSNEHEITFSQAKIREAKTRWGSCSAKHDIMLNSALVLCPLEVVRYVCIHELAHTRHFDHSAAFWSEVARHDPLYLQHRKALKQIKMPYWYH